MKMNLKRSAVVWLMALAVGLAFGAPVWANASPDCISDQVLAAGHLGPEYAYKETCRAQEAKQYYDGQEQAMSLSINDLDKLRNHEIRWDADRAIRDLKVMRDTGARLERDYKPPTGLDGKPLGNDALAQFLDRYKANFASQGWPAPDSISGGFDWFITQFSKQYQPQRAKLLQQATYRGHELLDLVDQVQTEVVETINKEAFAAQAKARNEAKAEYAKEHDTWAGHVAMRMEDFLNHMLGSLAFLALLIGVAWWSNRHTWSVGHAVRLFVSGSVADLIVGVPAVLFGFPWVSGWIGMVVMVLVWAWVWVGIWRYAPWQYVRLQRPAGNASQHDTHGSAAWADLRDLTQIGRLQPEGHVLQDSHGFCLGRVVKPPKSYDARVRYMGHVLTCAPTGAGKGTSSVIPTLLDYPGSALVVDIKGENYAVTAAQRRAMGHDVYLVDPFGVVAAFDREGLDATSHGFNWLDALDPASPDVVGEAAALADMLVIPSKDANNGSHFDETAKVLIAGLLVHVAADPDPTRRNMGEVRRSLTLPLTSDDPEAETLAGILADMAANPDAGQGIPFRAANSFMSAADKERASILSTAQRHTAFLDDPRVREAVSRTDFDLRDLKRRPMTVYLVLPPNRLAANTRFIRGFIGLALSAITSVPDKPPYHVLFLLDEFAQLGQMAAIEQAISLVRGYGARFWIFIQDLSQLKGVYPRKWQTFLANAGKQFFGTADYDTARYVSDSLGKQTIEFQTANTSSGSSSSMRGGSSQSGSGTAQQFSARELLTPDEVMRLARGTEILLIPGEKPAHVNTINYLHDPEYAELAEPNPYH